MGSVGAMARCGWGHNGIDSAADTVIGQTFLILRVNVEINFVNAKHRKEGRVRGVVHRRDDGRRVHPRQPGS